MLIPKFDLYKAEWLDLVFQNRNKAYGAYELRKHHGEDTFKALMITILSVASAALIVTIIARHKPQDDLIKITQVDNTKVIHLPPKDDKPLQPRHQEPAAAPKPLAPVKSRFIPTTVAPDTHPTIDPPTIAELQTTAVGPTNSEGATGINAPVTSTQGSGGTGIDPAAIEQGNNNEPILMPEINPEPVGGMAAWSKFLQRNMRYPDTDAQGRVIVSFIVERDGSLTDIKVMRGVSPELDNEALRVLKMAPKWKPGLQAGKPVRVQFNIPINFQLNN